MHAAGSTAGLAWVMSLALALCGHVKVPLLRHCYLWDTATVLVLLPASVHTVFCWARVGNTQLT